MSEMFACGRTSPPQGELSLGDGWTPVTRALPE
jgi:hypothetical protein